MKTLNKTNVTIDWKKFGSIDVKKFSEEIQNTSLINEFGNYIAFCTIEEEFDTQLMDQNFVKLFKFSQIIIEFLLKEFNRNMNSENEVKSHNNLIRENKKLKKLLEIHQKAITYNRTISGEYMQCPHCPKVFFDSNFLKTHISRRHPNESLDSKGVLSLTNKIDKYQTILLGDNRSIDELKKVIQELTQKLTKTELDLNLEKEERLKLEERIDCALKVRDKNLQQILKEEFEELKFIRREQEIENEAQNEIEIEKTNDLIETIECEEQNKNSNEVNRIEEMISIQAKEMIKLGNNVQKLVSHLTDNLPQKQKPLVTVLKSDENTDYHIKDVSGLKDRKREEALKTKEKFGDKTSGKDFIPKADEMSDENSKTIDDKRRDIETKAIIDEIENNLNEKLNSFGIESKTKGISDEQYMNAMKKVSEERDLLIQQNRFDYDFEDIERKIRKIVDKKVSEKSFQKQEMKKIVPKVKERKLLTVSDSEKVKPLETQTQRVAQKQPIEAIVHISPIRSVTSGQRSRDVIESELKTKIEDEVKGHSIRPKSSLITSSLKSVLSEKKSEEQNERKVQKRIRFNDNRIEHQISPDESTDESSEEYNQIESDIGTHSSADQMRQIFAPIPALRANKRDSNHDFITHSVSDNSSEDTNYRIDDQLMEEILETNLNDNKRIENESKNVFDKSFNNTRQTKVHELAEMIESQLSKRTAANKKPPIGSVNVMVENKQKLSTKPSLHSLNSDSEESD